MPSALTSNDARRWLRALLLASGLGLGLVGLISLLQGTEILEALRGRPPSTPENAAVVERSMWRFGWGCLALAAFLIAEWKMVRLDRSRRVAEPEAALANHPPLTRWGNVGGFALGLAAACGLLLPHAVEGLRRPFDYDETIEVVLDLQGPLWAPIAPRGFANHIGAAYLARFGSFLAGSPLGARFAFLALSILGISGVGWLTYTLTRRVGIALGAAAGLGSHWLILGAAYSIRGYAPYWVGFAGLTVLWVAYEEGWIRGKPARSGCALLTVVAASLAGSAHLFGVAQLGAWVILGLLVWAASIFWPERVQARAAREMVPALTLALAGSFLVWSPSIPWLEYRTLGAPVANGAWSDVPQEVARLAGVESQGSPAIVATLTLLLVVGVGLGARTRSSLRLPAAASAGFVACAVIAALTLSPTFFYGRFLVGALPALVATLATGLATMRTGAAGLFLLVSLLLPASLEQALSWPDARSAVRALEVLALRSAPGQEPGIAGGREEEIVIRYYLRDAAHAGLQDGLGSTGTAPATWIAIDGASGEDDLRVRGLGATHCRVVAEVGPWQSSFALWVPSGQFACRGVGRAL